MVIAMENSEGMCAQLLLKKGHLVVPLYGYNGAVDVIIYRNKTIMDLMMLQDDFGSDSGIFMICERNLLPEEVLKIVEQKNYGEGNLLSF